jgi:hypothetical protein
LADDSFVGVEHSRALFFFAQVRVGGVMFADRLSRASAEAANVEGI